MKHEFMNEASFYNRNFNDLFLDQEVLKGKVFESCIFEACDFTESLFDSCTFKECQFIKCKLTAVNIRNSKFSDVQFHASKILGVDWTKAYWRAMDLGAPLLFKECLLDASSFYGLKLPGIVFEDCRARDVDFREARLIGAQFKGTDLMSSLFVNCDLSKADFNGALNYDINVKENNLKDAIFCRYEAVSLLSSLGIKLV